MERAAYYHIHYITRIEKNQVKHENFFKAKVGEIR